MTSVTLNDLDPHLPESEGELYFTAETVKDCPIVYPFLPDLLLLLVRQLVRLLP